jgi:hypothetical protein
MESSGTEGGVAKDMEALTLLDNPITRNTFIDELNEVCIWFSELCCLCHTIFLPLLPDHLFVRASCSTKEQHPLQYYPW